MHGRKSIPVRIIPNGQKCETTKAGLKTSHQPKHVHTVCNTAGETTKAGLKTSQQPKHVHTVCNSDLGRGVTRSRNISGQPIDAADKNKLPVKYSGTVTKSYAERKRELQRLEDEISSLKAKLEESQSQTTALKETNSQQQSHLLAQEQQTTELENKLSTAHDRLSKCEHTLEVLGYDPVAGETIEEKENIIAAEIDEVLFTAVKFKDELLAFKDRNTEIISSLNGIMQSIS